IRHEVCTWADSERLFFGLERVMAQLLTAVAICALGGYLLWRYADRLFASEGVRLPLRLDRPEPGVHLIWDIVNTGPQPVTLTKLIVHGRGGATDTVPLGLPK